MKSWRKNLSFCPASLSRRSSSLTIVSHEKRLVCSTIDRSHFLFILFGSNWTVDSSSFASSRQELRRRHFFISNKIWGTFFRVSDSIGDDATRDSSVDKTGLVHLFAVYQIFNPEGQFNVFLQTNKSKAIELEWNESTSRQRTSPRFHRTTNWLIDGFDTIGLYAGSSLNVASSSLISTFWRKESTSHFNTMFCSVAAKIINFADKSSKTKGFDGELGVHVLGRENHRDQIWSRTFSCDEQQTLDVLLVQVQRDRLVFHRRTNFF